MNNIVAKARDFAYNAHNECNQKYAGKAYTFHLDSTYDFGVKYIHLIPANDQNDVLSGCFVHDVTEDTDYTYNQVKNALGFKVAEYAYACQNEKGRTREDKANPEYYLGIRLFEHATFVKICDRLANGMFSKNSGSSMYKKYKKEYVHFKNELYDGRFVPMWNELDEIFN